MSGVTGHTNGKASAFPTAYSLPENIGLTKREYFAAIIVAGLAPAYASGGDFHEKHIAKGALRIADALIEALSDDPRSQS